MRFQLAVTIVAPKNAELGFVISKPSADARFNHAEIRADQLVPWCRDDHRSTAIADHGKRPLVQLFHACDIAGRDSSDSGVEIFDVGLFQILRLEASPLQRPVDAPWCLKAPGTRLVGGRHDRAAHRSS